MLWKLFLHPNRTCEVLLLVKKLSELLELLNTNIGIRAEFNVDEANLGLARLLARSRDRGVAFEHLFGRACGEGHLCASGAAGVVAVLCAEFIEGDVDFVFGKLVALVETVRL